MKLSTGREVEDGLLDSILSSFIAVYASLDCDESVTSVASIIIQSLQEDTDWLPDSNILTPDEANEAWGIVEDAAREYARELAEAWDRLEAKYIGTESWKLYRQKGVNVELPSGREISVKHLVDAAEMLAVEAFRLENIDEAEESVREQLESEFFSLGGTEEQLEINDVNAVLEIVRPAAEELGGALAAVVDEYRVLKLKNVIEEEINSVRSDALE